MKEKKGTVYLNKNLIKENWQLYLEYFMLTIFWNFIPLFVAIIVDVLLNSLETGITRYYGVAVFALIFISIINSLLLKRSVIIEVLIRFFLGKKMRKNIIDEILKENIQNHVHTGAIVDVLNNDINMLEYIILTEIDFGVQVIFMVGSFIILFKINAYITLFSIIPIIGLAIFSIKLSEVLKEKYSEQRDESIIYSSFLDEFIKKKECIQFYGKEGAEKVFCDINYRRSVSKWKREKLDIWLNDNVTYINNVGIVLILALCTWIVKNNNNVTVGQLSIFVNYISYGYLCISSLNAAYSTLKYSEDSIERLSDIINTKKEKVVDLVSKSFVNNEQEPMTNSYAKKIEFINYRLSPEDQFHNFIVKNGEKILITGSNGSGKSRFLKSILGYGNYEGTILIDGIDVKKYSGKIGYISQEHNFFNDTILNNITLLDEKVDEMRVVEVLKNTNLFENMRGWEWNSDKVIGVNGECLSSGQRQRLLIARMLYENPSICLVDNPVSALDKKNREEILGEILQGDEKIIFIVNDKEEMLDFQVREIHFDSGHMVLER